MTLVIEMVDKKHKCMYTYLYVLSGFAQFWQVTTLHSARGKR